MRKLFLVHALVLLTAVVQAIIPDTELLAKHRLNHCCSPGMCDTGCYCCGATIYCTCAVDDDEALSSHHFDEVTIDIGGMGEPRTLNILKSNIDEKLQAMIKRNQDLINSYKRLIGSAEFRMKVWCPGSVEKLL